MDLEAREEEAKKKDRESARLREELEAREAELKERKKELKEREESGKKEKEVAVGDVQWFERQIKELRESKARHIYTCTHTRTHVCIYIYVLHISSAANLETLNSLSTGARPGEHAEAAAEV